MKQAVGLLLIHKVTIIEQYRDHLKCIAAGAVVEASS